MKGLVYKEFSLFYKSIDKKLIIIAAAAIILLLMNAGDFSGLLATIMFAMTVGMQNVMSFASDEQVRWKKYQLTMPVNSFLAVGSKYVSVLLTIGLSIVASIFLYFVAGIIYQSFDGQDIYKSIEEKAANFLYLIVKNHVFADGNKRIAATLFIYFLNFYGILYKNGKQTIDNNTLAALTLLIAESNPKEKEVIIDLVMNFLS